MCASEGRDFSTRKPKAPGRVMGGAGCGVCSGRIMTPASPGHWGRSFARMDDVQRRAGEYFVFHRREQDIAGDLARRLGELQGRGEGIDGEHAGLGAGALRVRRLVAGLAFETHAELAHTFDVSYLVPKLGLGTGRKPCQPAWGYVGARPDGMQPLQGARAEMQRAAYGVGGAG